MGSGTSAQPNADPGSPIPSAAPWSRLRSRAWRGVAPESLEKEKRLLLEGHSPLALAGAAAPRLPSARPRSARRSAGRRRAARAAPAPPARAEAARGFRRRLGLLGFRPIRPLDLGATARMLGGDQGAEGAGGGAVLGGGPAQALRRAQRCPRRRVEAGALAVRAPS